MLVAKQVLIQPNVHATFELVITTLHAHYTSCDCNMVSVPQKHMTMIVVATAEFWALGELHRVQ